MRDGGGFGGEGVHGRQWEGYYNLQQIRPMLKLPREGAHRVKHRARLTAKSMRKKNICIEIHLKYHTYGLPRQLWHAMLSHSTFTFVVSFRFRF